MFAGRSKSFREAYLFKAFPYNSRGETEPYLAVVGMAQLHQEEHLGQRNGFQKRNGLQKRNWNNEKN